MAKHLFSTDSVTGLKPKGSLQAIRWLKFEDMAHEFGFTVRVTKGKFLTREIDCDEGDFHALLSLI